VSEGTVKHEKDEKAVLVIYGVGANCLSKHNATYDITVLRIILLQSSAVTVPTPDRLVIR